MWKFDFIAKRETTHHGKLGSVLVRGCWKELGLCKVFLGRVWGKGIWSRLDGCQESRMMLWLGTLIIFTWEVGKTKQSKLEKMQWLFIPARVGNIWWLVIRTWLQIGHSTMLLCVMLEFCEISVFNRTPWPDCEHQTSFWVSGTAFQLLKCKTS